jgi:UDP-N-acetylmuramyl pentapeptide phosphotransferase/UDP-N-acetylglucosamine-1-phosphate transferase
MNTIPMMSGAIVLASFLISLYFLRFWRSTKDRFFLFFALSFALQGGLRIFLGINAPASEDEPAYYLVRLLAYVLILYAIYDKNRAQQK